jgi:hypothetical protein
MKQRLIYARHGVSLSRVPEAVQIILSRNQKMREVEVSYQQTGEASN